MGISLVKLSNPSLNQVVSMLVSKLMKDGTTTITTTTQVIPRSLAIGRRQKYEQYGTLSMNDPLILFQ